MQPQTNYAQTAARCSDFFYYTLSLRYIFISFFVLLNRIVALLACVIRLFPFCVIFCYIKKQIFLVRILRTVCVRTCVLTGEHDRLIVGER